MKKHRAITFFTVLILAILSYTLIKHTSHTNNELVFWTLQMRDFTPYMENVIANFEKNNPEIKIKWVDIPFSEGEKRTLAAILSSNPPDLINLNPDFSALLAKKGTLTEIQNDDLSQFSKKIVDGMKFNGKNYFIPWYATSAITFYNIEKFKTQPPKTYDEIFKICAARTKNLLMFNLAENDSILKLLNKYNINSPQTINTPEAAEIFKNLQKAYDSGCLPKESLTQTHRESLEKFMAEETALFEGGSNFLNLIKENAPKTYKKIGIAPQFVGPTNKYNYSMMNFIIPLKSKKRDEALKFALFLTNKENQLELGKLTNILATNRFALADEFYTKAPTDDVFTHARILSAQQLQNVQPQPFYPNRKDVITLINNATQKIILKEDSVENILNQLKKDWQKISPQ